jgi:hypothetical protein
MSRTPVFCIEDRRPVGHVDGWTTGVDGGREVLVRSGRWEPMIRRVAAVDVMEADEHGVVLRIDRDGFASRGTCPTSTRPTPCATW